MFNSFIRPWKADVNKIGDTKKERLAHMTSNFEKFLTFITVVSLTLSALVHSAVIGLVSIFSLSFLMAVHAIREHKAIKSLEFDESVKKRLSALENKVSGLSISAGVRK